MAKILKTICGTPEKPLVLAGVEIPCYVLENERRVITQNGLLKALGMSTGGSNKAGTRKIDEFMGSKALKPFVDAETSERVKDIVSFRIAGLGGAAGVAQGHDATILVDICDAILRADRQGLLGIRNKHIADRAEVLYKAFAKVGIIALVDEATGYQHLRDRNALYKILEAYISPTLLPWTKRFPDEFYKEMFRLNNWEYNPSSVKRPGVIGTWTTELIYEQLPQGVLTELKAKTPKNTHLHRSLTVDVGHPHLSNQLAAVTAIMRMSPNWRKFKENFAKAFKTGQQTLDLDESEN